MKELSHFLKKYRMHIILGPSFKLADATLELIIPIIMSNIIDKGISSGDKNYIIYQGLLIALLGALGLAAGSLCQYLAAKASQGFGTDLRNALYERINELSFFHLDSIGTSSLITRLTNDINHMQTALAMSIRLAVRAPFLLIGAIAAAFIIDKGMSLIFLIAVPITGLALYIIIGQTAPLFSSLQGYLDKLSLLSRENLDGNRVIRAFSRQENELNSFSNASAKHLNVAIKACRRAGFLNPVTFLIINASIIAIVWTGAIRINSGTILPGKIVALISYMSQILSSLFITANLVILFTKASAASKRVFQVLKIQPETPSFNKNLPYQSYIKQIPLIDKPKIEFKSVSFSYGYAGDKELSNISVKIAQGEVVGIIGGTGSGKTTFINLIPRFYDISEGDLLIDGKSVSSYPIDKLRSKIALVPQLSTLFSGTIIQNIKLGNPNISESKVLKALKISQCLEFIKKIPEGIHAHVERGGKNFSGGQKQRLSIARAIAKDAEILIFDDSSSALDAKTDSELKSAIKNLTNKTTIIISQKLSSIISADRILVFDDGQIVGNGTHNELLSTCKVYKEIYNAQMDIKGGHKCF